MINLAQNRWFGSFASIASELRSQASDACAGAGRWLGGPAKEADSHLMVAGMVFVTGIAVGVAVILSTVVPIR